MLAAITFDFDPLLRLGEVIIRWQSIGVTLALLAAFTVAALRAPQAEGVPEKAKSTRLRDMAFILAGVIPGAVVGGRLVHVLAFWDAYAAEPSRILQPSVGSLSLTGAVTVGLFSGAYVAKVLGAPVGRWMDAAAVPLLLAIGLGKFAQLLGGSGQGVPFDGPWAVAFGGGWPWVSANPELPSHPAQAYEGIWALIGIPIVLLLSRLGRLRSVPEGRRFAIALAWFLAGRVIVGFTWRDHRLLGALNAEQVIALALLAVVVVAPRLPSRARRRAPSAPGP